MARLTFTTIEDWAMPAKAGFMAFYETIAVSQLEGKWIRLSAKQQRAMLGHAVFGKQEICVLENAMVKVRRTVAFGADRETCAYEPHKVRYATLNALRIVPGAFGPGLFDTIH